jgi:hypothetical protein
MEHGGKRLPEVPAQSAWSAGPDQLELNTTAGLIDGLRSEYEQVIIAAPPVLSTMGRSPPCSRERASDGWADRSGAHSQIPQR